jgi:hypothetical protein
LLNPGKKTRDFKIDPDYIEDRSKLKLVFVSASPVLISEIGKFYRDFKTHFAV